MKEFSKETTESAEVKTNPNPMEDIKIAPKSEISVEQADDIYYNITEGIDEDVLDIEAEDENGTMQTVANGKYTNKEVVVSWEKPGIFDRDVKAYYYSVTNKNLSNQDI